MASKPLIKMAASHYAGIPSEQAQQRGWISDLSLAPWYSKTAGDYTHHSHEVKQALAHDYERHAQCTKKGVCLFPSAAMMGLRIQCKVFRACSDCKRPIRWEEFVYRTRNWKHKDRDEIPPFKCFDCASQYNTLKCSQCPKRLLWDEWFRGNEWFQWEENMNIDPGYKLVCLECFYQHNEPTDAKFAVLKRLFPCYPERTPLETSIVAVEPMDTDY